MTQYNICTDRAERTEVLRSGNIYRLCGLEEYLKNHQEGDTVMVNDTWSAIDLADQASLLPMVLKEATLHVLEVGSKRALRSDWDDFYFACETAKEKIYASL